MTQMTEARAGRITPEMELAAQREPVGADRLRELVAQGLAVIPKNVRHAQARPVAIGRDLTVKVNANIGTSRHRCDPALEVEKLRVSLEAGADTVMDLSTGGDLDRIRQTLLDACPIPLGTVPIYQVMVERESVADVSGDDIIGAVRRHAEQGVDFVTVHCGVTRDALPLLDRRLVGVVSRGGSFLVSWMRAHGEENPLYARFDEVLEIARTYDVTLSLGDGLRPGGLRDATDEAQLHELRVLGELVGRARNAGVQVMVEGPGHVPIDQIQRNMELQNEVCDGAPFYVLGPLVTDVAAGYDHISGAIGGALAAYHGAAFLCYVTPAEHLKLPEIEDVREGIIASRIAAHAADVGKGLAGARAWDDRISAARARLDWDAQIREAIDPAKARRYREESSIGDEEECTMCGPFCAIKTHRARAVKRTSAGEEMSGRAEAADGHRG